MSGLAERRVTLRLTEAEYQQLAELAFMHDRTLAWELRHALRQHLRCQPAAAGGSQRQPAAARAA